MPGDLGAAAHVLFAEDGVRLFSDVARYASFGPHRAGTASDAAAVAWLKAAVPREWTVREDPFGEIKVAGCMPPSVPTNADALNELQVFVVGSFDRDKI